MEDSDYIFTFIKLGSERDMKDLLENGTIYMNPVSVFKNLEDNKLRGDDYEGVSKIWNLPAGQFEIPSINFKGNYLHFHIRESYENVLGNVYCLYCISSQGFETPNDFTIDERVKEFGSHFVFIKDILAFNTRLRNALKLVGHKYYEGFVEYYDKNQINGSTDIFQKPNDFAFQREYRFYLESGSIFPLSIKLGSLIDIAAILPVESLNEIRFTTNIS